MSKKILLIGSFPPPYQGSVMDNFNLVKNWNSLKTTLSVLDISNHNKTFDEYASSNIQGDEEGIISINNTLSALKNWFRLIKIIPRLKYDYVLCHLSPRLLGLLKDSLIIFTIKLFTNAKINCRFPAGYFIVTKSKLYKNNAVCRYIVKYILRSIDQIITEGDCVNKEFISIDSKL